MRLHFWQKFLIQCGFPNFEIVSVYAFSVHFLHVFDYPESSIFSFSPRSSAPLWLTQHKVKTLYRNTVKASTDPASNSTPAPLSLPIPTRATTTHSHTVICSPACSALLIALRITCILDIPFKQQPFKRI